MPNETPQFAELQKEQVNLFSPKDIAVCKAQYQTAKNRYEQSLREALPDRYLDYLKKEVEELEFVVKYNELLFLLNKPCPMSWVREHETVQIKVNGIKRKLWYLPIDKVKYLLNRIFGISWKAEIVREGIMFNSVYVTVRLHYCIPGTNIWYWIDGTGAQAAQTKAGEGAANLQEIRSDAITKGLPSAASYALSNAAGNLGDLFGGNLNTTDAKNFAGAYNPSISTGNGVEYVDDEPKAAAAPITIIETLESNNNKQEVADFQEEF